MNTKIQENSPSVIATLVQALIGLAVSFGLRLTAEQVAGIMTLTTALIAVVMHYRQPPGGEPPPPPTKRISGLPSVATLVMLALGLSCCTAQELRTANDARNALCDLVGSEQRAAIESEGAKVGLSAADAVKLFRKTCAVEVKFASEQRAIGALGSVEK